MDREIYIKAKVKRMEQNKNLLNAFDMFYQPRHEF